MAGRPRTPSNVLELRGAFKKDPQRRREDLPGVGAFNPNPPSNLQQELLPAWREIVGQINPAVLTASDYLSIEIMARLLVQLRMTGDKSLGTELRQWFAQYGLTAVGRTKIAPPKKGGGGNPFADA